MLPRKPRQVRKTRINNEEEEDEDEEELLDGDFIYIQEARHGRSIEHDDSGPVSDEIYNKPDGVQTVLQQLSQPCRVPKLQFYILFMSMCAPRRG